MSYFTCNTRFAFGVDLSRYNTSADGRKRIDFEQMVAHQPQVVFAAMRAGISWGYQDPWFGYYASEARRVGILRLPYHVLYPGEDPVAQMDNFMRIVGEAELGELRLVLDVELVHDCSPQRITACVGRCLQVLQQRSGRLPIIYSRASWVNAHLVVADLPVVDWWLAQYRTPRPYPLYTPEYPAPPNLPLGVKQWLVHQSAEKAPSIAAQGCYYMDYDRWNGSVEDVQHYFEQADAQVRCPLDGNPCPGRDGLGEAERVALHLMQYR